ncbi:MAG: hypothetical protein KJZ83_15405 [Burkholderiaceae bacterium]|nr:hypothetical protein [Burkholderiaceae bacterium]
MTPVEEVKRQILAASRAIVPVARGCIYGVGLDLVPFGHLPDDGETRWIPLYRDRYAAIDPFHPRYFANHRDSVFCTNRGGGSAAQQQAYVQGFRRPMGMAFKTEIFLRDRNGRIIGGLRLSRTLDMGDFREWEVEALRAMQPVFSSAWLATLTEARAPCTSASLTAREKEVLQFMLEGATNKRICLELDLALPTVKCHVKNILRKTGASSRSQVVAQYYQAQMLG